MASSKTFGFAIDDVLVRVIPGLIPVGVAIFTYDPLRSAIPGQLSIEIAIIVGVVAYILGELANLFRERFAPAPTKFRRVLYSHTGTESHLTVTDSRRQKLYNKGWQRFPANDFSEHELHNTVYDGLDRDSIFEDVSSKYQINLEELATKDVFELIRKSISGEVSPRTLRLETFYHMVSNSVLWMFLILYFVAASAIDGTGISLIVAFLLAIVVIMLVYIVFIVVYLTLGIHDRYVESIINDYYVAYNGI